jgi:predicted transcriptional regulator
MSTTLKESVLDLIRRLPDDVTMDGILAELHFRQKVNKGLRQIEAGETIEHAEVKRRLGTWLD